MDTFKKTLSQNLRAIRKSKGLSTADLAEILGVSQAKISYIENCKGVLSAADVATLSKRLNVPVSEFFRGLDQEDNRTALNELVACLIYYGAKLLSKPPGITLKVTSFEDVLVRSLGYIEDDRLHKGFCTALITQASKKEINIDQIFAQIGNNRFLIRKAGEQAEICLKIIGALTEKQVKVNLRAQQQIERLLSIAHDLLSTLLRKVDQISNKQDLKDLAHFVGDCLNDKK